MDTVDIVDSSHLAGTAHLRLLARPWLRPTGKDDVAARCRSVHTDEKCGLPSYPATVANAALVLISVASSLLQRQLAAQSAAFEQEGGFTERVYKTRTSYRDKQ